ncbi:MAG: hypothetical protein M1820_002339 [Bogoriella megaspora]|nr:MAG: hypothetical protein M1820_002339 [Bogoriella megaspora]
MTQHLSSQPPETLDRIVSHVADQKDLKSIALCSKQFYEIAIPYVYRRLDFRDNSCDDQVFYNDLKHILVLFTRKPELAKHVRHLSIRPAFDDSPLEMKHKENPELPSLADALAQAKDLEQEIKGAIETYSQSEKEHVQWLQASDCEDVILALLLPILVNLETLDLEISLNPLHVERMLWRIGRREKPFDEKPALEKLHSIAWFHSDSKYGGNMAAGCFEIPSVRAVYLHRMSSYDDDSTADERLAEVNHGSSACTHIEMHDCRLNSKDIANIIKIPSILSTFIYEIGWGHLSYSLVDFRVIQDALEAHRGHLQDLWLEPWEREYQWLWGEEIGDGEEATCGPMKGFKDFPKLRRLRVGPEFVFGGWINDEEPNVSDGESSDGETDAERKNLYMYKRLLNFLPPSLESLQLSKGSFYPELLCEALEHLLVCKESQLPLLEVIKVEIGLWEIKQHGDRLANVLRLADSSAVKMIGLNDAGEGDMSYEDEVERKWGMDEDITWADAGSERNKRLPYEIIDLQY